MRLKSAGLSWQSLQKPYEKCLDRKTGALSSTTLQTL
jgi:hypothetical protein